MLNGDDKIFGFQGYTLDLRRGRLSRGDQQVELRPKSFALLSYLVKNSGRLASKDELIGAVWGDVAVTDVSLARCVSDVRFALRDRAQKIIKTVPRRGYLFAAPVSEADSEDAARGELQLAALSLRIATTDHHVLRAGGSGRLAARHHLEDLHEATTLCRQRCSDIIVQHQGYVARYSGGTLLAFFGYPEATSRMPKMPFAARLLFEN